MRLWLRSLPNRDCLPQLIRLQAEKAFIVNELASARNDYNNLEEEYLRTASERKQAQARPAAPANSRPSECRPEPEIERCISGLLPPVCMEGKVPLPAEPLHSHSPSTLRCSACAHSIFVPAPRRTFPCCNSIFAVLQRPKNFRGFAPSFEPCSVLNCNKCAHKQLKPSVSVGSPSSPQI